MSMSDPIADMLTRIRNGTMREHESISMPHSQMKERVAEVLRDEGYIEDYQVLPGKPQPTLRMRLKYVGDRRNRRSVINGLKRVSLPGRRVYVTKGDIPWVLSGMGITILTTPKGVNRLVAWVLAAKSSARFGKGGLACHE